MIPKNSRIYVAGHRGLVGSALERVLKAQGCEFLGSSCIYPRDCPQPIKEEFLLTGPLEPTNWPYAVAKIAGIEMCWSYNRQYGTRFLAVMPTNLYGRGNSYDLESSHVLPPLIRKFHLAKCAMAGNHTAIESDEVACGPIPPDVRASLREGGRGVVLWGTGSPRREFLYSDDMAEACVLLMALDDDAFSGISGSGASSPLVNIGCGADQTISELSERVCELIGYEGEARWDSSKPDGTPRKLLDVPRMTGVGWSARTDLRQGIRLAYTSYRAHRLSAS